MESILLVVDVDGRRGVLRAALADAGGRGVAFLTGSWPAGQPRQLERTLVTTLRDLVRRSGLLPQEVAGVVLVAEADQAMLWRADGLPLAGPLPLAGAGAEAAAAALEELRRSLPAGLPPAGGALRFGPLGAWLVAALCGGEGVAEAAGADRLGLLDRRARGWLPPARLGAAGAELAELLPPLRPSLGELGRTAPRVLDFPLPVVALLDRRVAEVAGHAGACWSGGGWPEPAEALLLLEEEATLRVVSGLPPEALEGEADPGRPQPGPLAEESPPRVAFQEGMRLYSLLEARAGPAGRLDRWLEEGLGLSSGWAETERLARAAAPDGPARLETGPDGRWELRGLDEGSGAAVLARLVVEAPATRAAAALEAWRHRAGEGAAPHHLHVGGLAALSDLRLQALARATGLPALRATQHAAVERGAVLLGARAVGRAAAGQEPDPFPATVFYPGSAEEEP
ncbi:MAG: hypothetical protein K6U79_09235 [Firmicutes bacterium]|nr:hypothetical protein [Bacillota bacterium]